MQWWKWLTDLEQLTGFHVPRCIRPSGYGKVVSDQLHHFSDASEARYGVVTYLRQVSNRNDFAMGKAQVASLKHMTIPRLELAAAVLAVRMDAMLRQELQIKLEELFFLTDSTSLMCYYLPHL